MLLDTIIIGSGPAGLTASIYSSRYKLNNMVMGNLPGGTISYAHKVANFPGLPGIAGAELGQKILSQAKELGAEVLAIKVKEIKKMENEQGFEVTAEGEKKFLARTIIAATGTERRKLDIPGEREYFGRGVTYCTNCDAPFFKDKTLILVGGANAACSGALHLAQFAQKVFLIYRKSELRAEPVWVEEVKENPKIEVIYNTNLVEILGDGKKVTGAKLDSAYQGNEVLAADGVFVEIGGVPLSNLFSSLGVLINEDGYILVDDEMQTNIPGLFAAGDLTSKSIVLQQVITACGQGAIAAFSAFKYLKSK